MENAVSAIHAYLAGDKNARIECNDEGELYRLFHSVNSLVSVLNAHAAKELREKEFLKNTSRLLRQDYFRKRCMHNGFARSKKYL